jgi:phenylpyruvate tautomerase PptA (4-oxalocrotonate tautomerase family)
MPLVRITLREGHSVEERRAISDGIYSSMLDTVKMPEHDYFHVILEQSKDNLIADETYLNIPRTGNSVFVEITLLRGRTVEVKRALYRQIAERLSANPGIPKEDILIVLTENDAADWSFGMGEAQYAK